MPPQREHEGQTSNLSATNINVRAYLAEILQTNAKPRCKQDWIEINRKGARAAVCNQWFFVFSLGELKSKQGNGACRH